MFEIDNVILTLMNRILHDIDDVKAACDLHFYLREKTPSHNHPITPLTELLRAIRANVRNHDAVYALRNYLMASLAHRPPSFEGRFPHGILPIPEKWYYNGTATVASVATGCYPVPSDGCDPGGSSSIPIKPDLFRDCIEDYGLDAVQPLRVYTIFGYQTLFDLQSLPADHSNLTQPFGAVDNPVINRTTQPRDHEISSTANDEENWTPEFKSVDQMTRKKSTPARRSTRLSAVGKEGEGGVASTDESIAPPVQEEAVDEDVVFLNRNGKPVKNSRFWTYTTQ